MPLSRKRKKNGKKVRGHTPVPTPPGDAPTGVTLQELINVVAYQEYVKDGSIVPDQSQIDFDDPDTQAVIRAMDSKRTKEESE